MIRILLLYISPLLFPAAIYFLWIKLRGSPDEKTDAPREDPWFWLILGGLLLMGAALAFMALAGDKITEGAFSPDRLENGRIIPGTIDPPLK